MSILPDTDEEEEETEQQQSGLSLQEVPEVISPAKAACRQVQLRNAETSTIDLQGSKQDTGSHLCGKAESFLVEVIHRRSHTSKVGLFAATAEVILSYQPGQTCM